MIDDCGHWHDEPKYSEYPESEWCDMDYVVNWIQEQGYNPKTSMESVILNILAHYDNEKGCEPYFAIPDKQIYPDNLMINIPDVAAFVDASGGLQEFDYKA